MIERCKVLSTIYVHLGERDRAAKVEVCLAERVGFEPTCPFGQDAFEAPPLRPLRYLSDYLVRRDSKNACIICRHSSSSTPLTAVIR